MRRLAAAILGLVLGFLVFGAGYWALFGGPVAVAAFGIASAFLAPLSLSSLGLAAGFGQSGLITRLARVPEIERLLQQADSEAERLALLQAERVQLERIVEGEVQRGLLLEQRKRLRAQADELVAAMDLVDAELARTSDTPVGQVSEAITNLRARLDARRRGDLVISVGGDDYVIDADLLGLVPFGNVAAVYVQALIKVVDRLVTRKTR